MSSRILLIQLRRIGDVLMTTPAVGALRRSWPDAWITYLTESPSHQVLVDNPHIDEVLCWPRRKGALAQLALLRRLRGESFDLVMDFFSNPTSALITWLSGARERIGFDFRGRRWAYTQALGLPEQPYAAQHKLALLQPLGIPSGGLLPRLYLTTAQRAYAKAQLKVLGVGEQELVIAICPVSRREYKVWPAAQYARLADVLIERYSARVLFVWGPGEEHFVDAVRLGMMHQALPSYAVPSLMELAALLERAHLLVGNDNGLRHFAIAVGTPTVGVMGKPLPENWTPPRQPMHLAVDYDPGCKRSCVYPRCGMECIKELPYTPVEAAVESLLEEVLKNGIPV